MSEERLGIGIIGGGFVGSSIAKVFHHYVDTRIYDVNPDRSSHSFLETIKQDLLYVCLPTPMAKDGRVDLSFVRNALEQIAANLVMWRPVILKSTLPPVELVELAVEFKDSLALIFSPEFLTERTAEYDLQQSNRFIFGALPEVLDMENHAAEIVQHIYETRFPGVARYWVDLETASLVKYFTNVFFATKVSIFNEYHQVASQLGVDPQEAISLLMLDPRIGRSHFQVPGHDGGFGYSGSCFLKDINGYMHLVRDLGIEPTLAMASWKKNLEVRGVDNLVLELQKMLGRAASDTFTAKDLVRFINPHSEDV